MANVTTSAETNLSKSADHARVREVEFVEMFGYSVKRLMEALGVTRKIEKVAGTVLKTYKARGTLESGIVGEGEIIPLSKYETEAVSWGEITLKKWRKATSAEAILDHGYDEAVTKTNDKMLQDVQKSIRADFFGVLSTGNTAVGGETFQKVLARSWGALQVLFEDDSISAVHFMNPLDVADYLATASITLQTVFGMNYVENFLGLGTVFFNSSVPQGKIYSTAKENLICYYVKADGSGLDEVFDFTTEETGLIGIHEDADYKRLTAESVVVSGVQFLAERIDGVVVGIIDATPTLGTLTVTSVAGTASGDTAITVTETKGSGNSYFYKVGTAAEDVKYGDYVGKWTAWDGTSDITAATGKVITIVEADAQKRADKAGHATVTAKS